MRGLIVNKGPERLEWHIYENWRWLQIEKLTKFYFKRYSLQTTVVSNLYSASSNISALKETIM